MGVPPRSSEVSPNDDYYCDTPDNIREVRPFYWVMLVVLAVIYVWILTASPELRAPSRLVPFTGLMLVHAGLHWTGPYLTTRRRWLVPYLLAQAALVFVITWVGGNQGVGFGLYLLLAGESVGILENVAQSTVVVVGLMALSALNFLLMKGWSGLSSWLLLMAPMMFFVIVYVAMFIRQAKARERAQDLLRQLEAAHRQLETYASQVEQLTLAQERQRMARELHDTLAQGLAGLILQLEAADSYLTGGRHERAQAVVQQAMARGRASLAEARRAIGDLRAQAPAAAEGTAGSDRLPLDRALQAEVERLTASGLICQVSVAKGLQLPAGLGEQVQRFVTEALSNTERHARAGHVWVQVESPPGELIVSVRDDGVGFDPGASGDRPGHYGLVGLRERARLAGGELEVQSAPGRGTLLRMRLPLPEATLA